MAVLCASVLLAALVTPSWFPARARADGIDDKAKQVAAALKAASADEDDAGTTITAASQALSAAQGQLAAAQTTLAQDRAQLGTAQAAALQADDTAAAAQAQLTAASQQLVAATQAVDTQQQLIDSYARAAYETGASPTSLDVVAAGDGTNDYVQKAADLDLAARGQSTALTDLRADRQQVANARTAVAQRTRLVVARQQAAHAAEARVAAIVTSQQTVTARLAGLAQARDTALGQAQAALAADRSRVGQLQAESTQIQRLLQSRASRAASSRVVGSEDLIWPVSGPITSPFGYRVDPVTHQYALHAGIDIGAAMGTPIKAAKAGTVIFAGQETGYGNYTCIDHGGGFSTCYAHQSKELVTVGETVAQGQVIGLVGDTGYTTGPHLHFETRVNGVPKNPLLYL